VGGGGRPWLEAGFPALRHRNFRLFVVGQGTSLIGFWMQSVAQGWLVYRLSGSAFAVGLVAFCGSLPILCCAPAGGVLVDRVSRHRLLIATQTILMLLALGVAALIATHRITVHLLMVFAAGVGLTSAFDVPARQAFIVQMVGAEDLPSAIALNSSIFNAARVIGPALAGSLLGAVGEAACYFSNAASYVAVLVALMRMRLPSAAPHGSAGERAALGAALRLGTGRAAEPAPAARHRRRLRAPVPGPDAGLRAPGVRHRRARLRPAAGGGGRGIARLRAAARLAS